MAHNMNELKKQIVQKNKLLEAVKREKGSADESVRQVKRELDALLYQYYKLLKCS